MTPAIPDSALRLVASYFDPATVRRAVELVDDGRVHLVKSPPWPVVARVRDDVGHVVTVDFNGAGSHLRGDCSCAVAVDCAHAAATALLVFAEDGAHAVERAEAARQAVVGEWLADLGRHRGKPAVATPTDRVVVYLLDDKDGDLGVTALAATRLRRGSLTPGAVIAAPGDPQRGAPPWVDADDLRRLAMLRAVTRAAPQVTRLPIDRIHGELLADLAAGGLLFWGDLRGAPLHYAPPIADTLRWRASPDQPDAHRLGLEPHLVIVPARECHYLDPATGALGRLELGVPAELVARLITSPPVPASMRATVERSLRPLLTEAAGPLAVPRDDDAVPMRPRMIATIADSGHQVQIVGQACYGEQRFALAGWDPMRGVARDLVGEGEAQARLTALIGGLPHGALAGSSLDLLADARHVAQTMVPALRAAGWDCELSDDFPHQAPLLEVGWVERLRPVPEARDWFAVELGVTIAGRTVPLLPILLQAIRDGELVLGHDQQARPLGGGLNVRLPEGELVHVPAERVARWLRPLVELELRGLSRGDLLIVPAFVAAAIDDDEPGCFGSPDQLAAARQRLAALLELAPRTEGKQFEGTLRPYQRLGLAWLRFLHDAGYGGLLADEMGLGKTVQVLAFLDGLRTAGKLTATAPALVVAPRSVVGNWEREALRFAPRLRPVVHLGADRGALTDAPLLITSYQTLLRDLEPLRRVSWTSLILDEAQAVKNPDTQLRDAVASLRATSRFCITGTPIENHLGELWSQLDLAMPGLLGRRRSFDAIFRKPIEKYGDDATLERLRQRIRPFLLRRTKERVEIELPPKTEVIEQIELDTAQRDLYEALRLKLDDEVRLALKDRGLAGSSIVILDALLKLRQCCCDPRLVRLPEARRVTGSAKLERLIDMLTELADSGRSTLVFSQFTTMLGLIEQACARAEIPTLKLTGATRDRDQVVQRFQAGAAPVFLISLKAGGVGLNLTRADTVIHYDPWWNPGVEAQATDRAHRIGQDKHLMVYKLIARATVEEAIVKLQGDKRQLTDAALRDGGVTHLGAADLHALFGASR